MSAPEAPVRRLAAYAVCEQDDDCEEGLTCETIFSVDICVQTGCRDDESVCDEGTNCALTPGGPETGVCARTGGDQVCARNCRDPLVCNLDVACSTAGCCNPVDAEGCPSTCADLGSIECEISPRCPERCCR